MKIFSFFIVGASFIPAFFCSFSSKVSTNEEPITTQPRRQLNNHDQAILSYPTGDPPTDMGIKFGMMSTPERFLCGLCAGSCTAGFCTLVHMAAAGAVTCQSMIVPCFAITCGCCGLIIMDISNEAKVRREQYEIERKINPKYSTFQ